MTPEIVVVAPVLDRPENALPLAQSLADSTDVARLLFVCSPGDDAEQAACRRTGSEVLIADWEPGRADWAKKLELARAATSEPFLLLGADDLEFHPGWADAALDVFARQDVGVVGTNDLANPRVRSGLHSTHPVVCRGYADHHGTIDDPAVMLHLGYWHLWVDNELVQTAMRRGCWAFARDARVEHRHPIWGTAGRDATYDRGSSRAAEDQALYNERRRLWTR